jgi:hypothetical protein
VGDVEEAQSVAPGRHAVVGHVSTVDQDTGPNDPIARWPATAERVGQLVVAVEGAVGNHQRDVTLTAGQRQRSVELVVDDPHSRQATPDVAGRVVEPVVVVPLQRSPFGPPVLDQIVDVGLTPTRLDQLVVA